MILYNVTVNVEASIVADWLQWMQTVHIPAVMKTGIFQSYKLLKLLNEEENNTGVTFAVQYFCETLQDYHQYQNTFAKELQFEHSRRYNGKFVAFRTLLEEV
jgi:Domain of unknown function (DUF4286)